MNFLAHLYLSGEDTGLMVGNFIADFVKGRSALQKFDPEIVRGIRLHRSIDAFTDTHAVVTQSKNRLRSKYRHYSGVIVDVFYDHFLASNWSHYHTEPLAAYAARVYRLIQRFEPVLPQEVKYMLPYMIDGNWLVNYGRVEGIHRALSGMAKRTPFNSRMEEATQDLIENADEFKKEFEVFFPELVAYCKTKIADL
jgi:acyl carrier protein phosphodiesterase